MAEIRAPGYEPYRRSVRVGSTGVVRLDATLTPQRRADWVLPVAVGGGVLVAAAPVVTTVLLVSGGTEAPQPASWGNVTEAIQAR